MPRMVTIIPNPKPTAEMKRDPAWEAISKSKPKTVAYQTAIQNVKWSKGLYVIRAEDQPMTQAAPSGELESLPMDQLKVLMLQLGIKTEKQMKKADVISLIRTKLGDIEIVDDAEG